MRRSRSRASAAASSAGVSSFEKSCLDATSVISSRVRWDRIVEIRTLNGSSVSPTMFERAVSAARRSPSGRYRRERSRTMNAIRSRADAEMVKGLPRGVNRGRDQEEVVFFSSRRRHTRFHGDWSSDVCSSDLLLVILVAYRHFPIGSADFGDEDYYAAEAAYLSQYGFSAALSQGTSFVLSLLIYLTSKIFRSEERRVGKECRSRWSPYH